MVLCIPSEARTIAKALGVIVLGVIIGLSMPRMRIGGMMVLCISSEARTIAKALGVVVLRVVIGISMPRRIGGAVLDLFCFNLGWRY